MISRRPVGGVIDSNNILYRRKRGFCQRCSKAQTKKRTSAGSPKAVNHLLAPRDPSGPSMITQLPNRIELPNRIFGLILTLIQSSS